MCAQGIHIRMKIPKTGKMRYICHSGLRGKEGGQEIQR